MNDDLNFGDIDPPAHIPERTFVNVNDRREHEAMLKDAICSGFGFAQTYGIIVYLKQWGSLLEE